MKQQILWVVEYRSISNGKWFVAEACLNRREGREALLNWRRLDNYVRLVKFLREA